MKIYSTPTDEKDVVNKGYVDSEIVNLTGLVMNMNYSFASQIDSFARKSYVDSMLGGVNYEVYRLKQQLQVVENTMIRVEEVKGEFDASKAKPNVLYVKYD